ncbi:MNIO family bufferin maturase [Azospirillum sp. B2RO_4]|uniref:MNIO family bufferin maturase n=1 Tax=Azospirillum sp. B2RO_4 TaxID=3027796 RepID=UPI003DA8799B
MAAAASSTLPRLVPVAAGIGLREPHREAFVAAGSPIPWVEIHPENYLVPGGPRLAGILRVRRDRPVSCHGVGLSLGSAGGLDPDHLMRLRALYDRLEPGLISEHLSWSVTDATYLNDLLPLPYTEDSLERVRRNIDHAQDVFGRRILVENPAACIAFADSTIPESEFLAELAARTGCGLLLDVNNLYVSSVNLGFDRSAWLDAIPADAVGELHLAGHTRMTIGGEELLVDDHGSAVGAAVMGLYAEVLERIGPRPVLIEWDNDLPPLDGLLDEAGRAQRLLDATMQKLKMPEVHCAG